jgi:hypothetical protein
MGVHSKSILMIKKSLGIFGSGILFSLVLLSGQAYAQSITDNWNEVNEGMEETVNSYFDEFSYLCLNLENLGGLEDDNDQVDEKTKQDCKKQLETIDIIKKKELIQKYGELDG